jgi:catechol 2,3-dioxygenase-like lactoylglutathione lyase family enzyme
MTYLNASPVLRVSDYQRAKAFYMHALGFDTVVNEAGDPEPGFGIFRAGEAQIFLHSWDGPGESWDNWRAYFYTPDIEALQVRLSRHGTTFKGPTDTWYGMREIEVTDPDGNILCFGVDASQVAG